MKRAAFAVLLAAAAYAQPAVAPTNEPVGVVRGEDTAEYNVRQSFELGYRWRSVGGNEAAYRGMVNFGNGVRLLGSSLSVQSLEGRGRWFDQIQLNTQGLGNDPYQNANLRFEKNRLYRYDLNWRSTAYYNQGLYNQSQPLSFGRHAMDTVRNVQDHDVTFLPQSGFKVFLGFSRNSQRGPALSSLQLFDARGDEFPLLTDVRRQQHEYRAGFELGMMGWRLNLLHGWVNFKEDTPFAGPASAGNNPADPTTLTAQRRSEPYHGNSPYWRIALFKEARRWVFNGRFTYVTGRRAFVTDETLSGTDRFGQAATRQILALGDARRPAATGVATFSIFPSNNVTLTNQTSLSSVRMVGNAAFTQVINGSAGLPFVPFTYLGIRTAANQTDLDYRPVRAFGVRAGYQYSSRRIRSIEDFGGSTGSPVEQTNGMHTGLLGVRFRPARPLAINLDAEIGRADRPIFPISQRNLQAFRGRIEFKRGAVRLAGYARSDYSTNSASLANYASRSRQYGGDATWTISPAVFIDASYARLHLDTLGAINYFVGNQLQSNGRSYYASNLHTASIAARFSIGRADISLGASHVQDTGDGRAAASLAPGPFPAAQTFPLRFTSPQGRLSLRLAENLRWNAGYQHYGYSEEFGIYQNFRAHTGYSSVSWSF